MPEGDTVYLTARRLREALAGRELTRSEFRVPRWATVDLRGRTVDTVIPRGKHLLIGVGDLTIHSHLRLEGSWRIDRAGARPSGAPSHQIRIILGNDRWQASGFRVPVIDVVRAGEEDRFVEHLGPDILGPDWDAERAVTNLLAHPDRAIGEALLDQRNLAGIGNMYMAETCFINRVHPASPVNSLPDLRAIVATAYRLLQANKDRPSQSTLFMSPTQAEGRPSEGRPSEGRPSENRPSGMRPRGVEQWVYGRAGKPCMVCGTHVRSALAANSNPDLAARRMYWCPTCQPER